MARYTKQDALTVPQINNELEKIEQAIQDTLSRKGDAPNTMTAPLDMNGERVLNLPEPVADTDPLRKIDAEQYVDAAASSAAAALASQQAAAASETSAASSASIASSAASTSEELTEELSKLYLGSFSVNPTTDNEGEPLVRGVLYYNTVEFELYVYNGSAWVLAASQQAAITASNAATAAAASAATATTQAGIATTQAGNAASSATSASSSASSASTSATNAAASETAAASSASTAQSAATSATASASAASTSETNAAASESAASTSETNAASSASSASGSATSAASSASAAATSESNAAGSATAAAGSASAASDSADAALASEQAADAAASAAEDARDEAVLYASAFSKGLIFIGVYDASSGVYPTLPDPLIGNPFWIINVAGTISGTSYDGGDTLIYDSTAESWIKLDTTDRVVSVAGKVGAVTLVKADVGLSNVDNTSDLNKPISTATQAALDGKVNSSDQEIIDLKSEQSKVNSSLVLDFAKNDFRVYEQFAGLTPKQFTDLASLTRATNKTGFTPTKLATASSGVAVQNEYDPATGEPLGLSVHEQRTNLLTYSEQFDNAVWIKGGATTISSNAETAPDGTVSADLFYPTLTGVFREIYQNKSLDGGVRYTQSYFVKGAGFDACQLLFPSAFGASDYVNFDLINGEIGSIVSSSTGLSASIKDCGDGWFRISASFTGLTSSSAARCSLAIVSSPTSTRGESITPNGTDGIYIWGAQLEAGSFATPYIKTEATTATRNADVVVINDIDDSEWWNASEGTFVFDAYLRADHGVTPVNSGFFQIGTDTSTISSNSISLFASGSTAGRYLLRYGSISAADLTGISGSRAKIAVKYTATGTKMSINGSAVSAEVAASTDAALFTQAKLGFTSSGYLNSNIANFTYYPTAVSDAKLQELSTL